MEVMDIARLRKVNELASILSKNRLVANKMEAADMASNLAGRKSEQDLKKSVVDKNQYLVHEENIQEQRMQQAQQMQKPVENVVTKDELNVFYNKISLQNSMEFDKMKSLMTDLTSTISSYQKQMQSLQNELSALNQEHSQLRTEYNALSVQIIQALEQAAQPQIAENQSEVLEPVSSELVSSVQEAPQNFQQEVQEQLFSEQVAAEIAQEATEAVQEAQELNVQDQNELQVSEQVNEVNEEFNAETLDNGEFTCNETVCNETVAIADSNEELMQQSVNELESANEPYMQADMESDTQVDTVNEFSEEQFVEAENSNGQNNEQQFLSEEISAETVSLDDQQFVSNTYEELESQVQQDQEQQEQQEASTNYAEQKNLVEEENFIEPENLGVVEQQDFQQDFQEKFIQPELATQEAAEEVAETAENADEIVDVAEVAEFDSVESVKSPIEGHQSQVRQMPEFNDDFILKHAKEQQVINVFINEDAQNEAHQEVQKKLFSEQLEAKPSFNHKTGNFESSDVSVDKVFYFGR